MILYVLHADMVVVWGGGVFRPLAGSMGVNGRIARHRRNRLSDAFAPTGVESNPDVSYLVQPMQDVTAANAIVQQQPQQQPQQQR